MEKSNEKRARILDAAIDVFCAQGYDAASMAQVAAKAGIAKGTLYLYFESKQSLFEQTYQLCMQQRMRRCCEGIDPCAPVPDQLSQRLRNGMRWELEAPLKNRLVRVYQAHPQFNAALPDCPWASIGQLMEQGLAAGELRPLPQELLGELFTHFGSAVYYYIAAHPHLAEDEALWENIRAGLRGCLCAD